jgi:hypothetical protein
MTEVDNLSSIVQPEARIASVADAPNRDVSVDDLTIALEEGCGVLVVLEASRARIAGARGALHARGGLYETEAHLTVAIESLRQALALLREQTRGTATSALADGFVVRRRPDQASPLRTA